MNTKIITLGSIDIPVLLKDIKNVHLSVYPPHGEVRVSAPLKTNLDTLRVYLSSRITWIKKHQLKFNLQKRVSPREFLTRESHYIRGKRCLMEVITNSDHCGVEMDHTSIKLHLKSESDASKTYQKWQRSELKKDITTLLQKWEPEIGVKSSKFVIRKMKTRWGSCNPVLKTINLNLNLIEKAPEHLEYVVVHELIHLIERKHNANFVAHMDKFIPNWKQLKSELNSLALTEI